MLPLPSQAFTRILTILTFTAPLGCSGSQPGPKAATPAVEADAQLAYATAATPGAHYYVTIFGAQGRLALSSLFYLGRKSHTFASFAAVTDPAAAAAGANEFTISWLPATSQVRASRRAEPGRNFTLGETLAIAAERGLLVRRWGPIEVSPAFYAQAQKRFQELNAGATSGRIQYDAIDTSTRSGLWSSPATGAVNCIHALSDLASATPDDALRTGVLHGFAASRRVLGYFRDVAPGALAGPGRTPDSAAESIAERFGYRGVPFGGN